jgi:hypothetical protein
MKKLLLLCAFICLSPILRSQTPLNFVSATVGGSAYEICYYDNYVFAGCANTFRVYDLTGPNNKPDNIHYEERFISNIDQMLVHDGYLYICANHAGLLKYDIADPENPVFVDEYIPADLQESIYDIAFYGDSLLVAAKNKLLVIDGNTLDLLSVYNTYGGDARIRGIDIKDSLMAYTVAYPLFFNPETGVYLVDLNTMTELDFYQNTGTAQCEVYFGQSTELLHVMGGQISIGMDGYYFALNYSDPSNIYLEYDDTIFGIPIVSSISAPMSAFIVNDTVYISTQGGGPYGGGPVSGQLYVYDATVEGNIQFLTDIYGGLYHFDADFDPANRKMYIASEWYGILTVDFNDIYAEINHGKTLTGGWCHGSAQAGDRLVEANEGYGIRLFNVADRSNPFLIDEDTTVGFCRAVAMDETADYVYGFFLTGKHFRVYDANTLDLVADTTIEPMFTFLVNFQNARYDQNRIAVIEEILFSAKRIVVMDVSNPLLPAVDFKFVKDNAEQVQWLSDGNLLVCAQDSLVVYDGATMAVLSGVAAETGMQFKALAAWEDTLHIFESGATDSIGTYYYNAATNILEYLSSSPYTMLSDDKILMTTDDTLIYISSSLDSLRGLEKVAPHNQVAVYNHGADHIHDGLWGVQDLYYNDGYLFLNEYMGQTTILNTLPFDDSGLESEEIRHALSVYPNPSSTFVTAEIPFPGVLSLNTLDGRSVWRQQVSAGSHTFDISDMRAGLYLLRLDGTSHNYSVKVLVE